MGKMGLLNKFKAINSILFIVIGIVIIFRSLSSMPVFMPIIVGLSFICLGVYRSFHVLKYLRGMK